MSFTAQGRRLGAGGRAALPLVLLLLGTGGWTPVALRAQAPEPSPVLIRNARIETVSHGAIERGEILIRDGKIAAVANSEAGESLQAPDNARIIDASGGVVMPGIIDAHSHIAVDGGVNELSLAVTSMVDVRDALDPEHIAIYRALAGGVTTASILHGSANPVGGQTRVVKFRWGKTAEQMLFEGAAPGLKLALGENPKRVGNQVRYPGMSEDSRYPATRMGIEDVLREAFTHARVYQGEWELYRRRSAGGERAFPPRVDLALEPLREVLEGTRLVHAHCYRADEILMLLQLADEFGFRVHTLQHALEGYQVAQEIARHGAAVSTFSDWWSYKLEAVDAIPYNAAVLHRAGVLVSLNSDDAELMRHLNTEAAKVIKYGGLTRDEALAMITLNPARQLGIDSRVGSIDVGKDADLVLFDQDPLSSYAKVEQVWIDGELYFDRQQDAAEQIAREIQREELLEKAVAAGRPGGSRANGRGRGSAAADEPENGRTPIGENPATAPPGPEETLER